MTRKRTITALILCLLLCVSASATTYYVKNTGDDAKSGLDDANAWETIAKVNGISFSAGDFVLFNRGDTWVELLTVPTDGSAGSPITFGAYGTGNLPIITGCREVPGWTVAGDWTDEGGDVYSFARESDRHRLWLDGTEYPRGLNAADVDANKRYAWVADVLYVYSPTGKPPTDYTTMVESNGTTAAVRLVNKDYITLEYLDLRGGNTTVYLDTGCSNFIIDNCAVGLDGFYGFFIRGSMTGEIKNCTVESGWNFPTYTSNELYQQACTWDGIYLAASTANSGSFLIHDNTFKDWGHNGICFNATVAPYTLSNCEVYDNEISGENSIVMRAYTTETDDADLCINNKFYRNNCHDTTKSSHINGNGNEVYYNIFRDVTNIVTGSSQAEAIDLEGYVGGDCKDNKIYNNVFVNIEEPGIDISGDGAGDKEGNEITNNIFYNTGYNSAQAHDTALWIDDHATILGNTFKNNLFYTSGMTDVVSYRGTLRTIAEFNAENGNNSDVILDNIGGDPLFVDAANDIFRLQVGSPCINTGYAIEDIVPPGLFAHYMMNDNAATSAVVDETGNHAGVYTDGGGAINTDTGDSIGWLNGALDFDGGDEYVEIADNVAFTPALTPFSISAWIYMHVGNNFHIASKGVGDTLGEWKFQTDNNYKLYSVFYDDSDGGYIFIRSDDSIQSYENRWIHVVLTYNGGIVAATSLNLYINAMSIASELITITFTAVENLAAPVYIGRYSTFYANGLIDNVMFFNTELSQAQVSLLYQPVDYQDNRIGIPPEMGAYSKLETIRVGGKKSGGHQTKSGGKR